MYTHQLMHLYIYIYNLRSLKFTLKHLNRSSSESTYCSMLKLYIKTISDSLSYINFSDVAACHVSVCVSYDAHTNTPKLT